MKARVFVVFAALLHFAGVVSAWVVPAGRLWGAAVVVSSLSLGAPGTALAESAVAVTVPQSVSGNGGIDAFAAAGRALADPRLKMKSLSGNDFELVKKGEKALSNAPRASKRRALQECRDSGSSKFVGTGKKGLFGEETIDEKTCINRVMDGDYKFILDAADKAAAKNR